MYDARIDPFSETEPGAALVGQMFYTIRDAVTESEYKPKVGAFMNDQLETGITNLTVQIADAKPEIARRTAVLKEATARMKECAAALGRAEGDLASVSNKLVASGIPVSALTTDGGFTNALAVAAAARREHDDAVSKAVRADQIVVQGSTFLRESEKKRSEMRAELSRRFALGIAPVVFMLLGIPLGIRTSRRESNIGVAISLSVMILYYAFLIIAKSLSKRPEFYPHVIIWIPSLICLVISVFLIRKNQ